MTSTLFQKYLLLQCASILEDGWDVDSIEDEKHRFFFGDILEAFQTVTERHRKRIKRIKQFLTA